MELSFHNVTKCFGGVKALDAVSLTFRSGEITALVGPNGAGKTTLFSAASGFIRPEQGNIAYGGQSLVGMTPQRIASLGIGRLFQDLRVFDRLSVRDNVMVAARRQIGEQPLVSLVLSRRSRLAEKRNGETAGRWLEFVGLHEVAHLRARQLSFGQQKLLAIARLLANEADFLLLDEPAAGINPDMADDVLDLIRRLAEMGKTVVMIEHNLDAVRRICRSAYLMADGRVIDHGSVEDVLRSAVQHKVGYGA